MKKNSDQENKNLCQGCSLCCEYVCVPMDNPTTKTDFDDIIWLLVHKNVWVYLDDKNDWYVQFNTPCKKLKNNKSCGIYHNRPNVCRKHTHDSCERYGDGSPYNKIFRNKEEFMKWLKQKKKNYNFKHFKH